MYLDSAHNLQASMNQNASAGNNQTGMVAWVDVPGGPPVGQVASGMLGGTAGVADFQMNGTVVTTIVNPPKIGYTRVVTLFQLFNADNATDTLILQRTYANNANNNIFYKASQLTLANWVYIYGVGWKNQSAAGLSL